MLTEPVVGRRYVYYRVPEAALGHVVQAVRALQARHAGQPLELLQRADVQAGVVTLMEVYAPADAALADAREADAAEALAPWLLGQRHVETFEPLY